MARGFSAGERIVGFGAKEGIADGAAVVSPTSGKVRVDPSAFKAAQDMVDEVGDNQSALLDLVAAEKDATREFNAYKDAYANGDDEVRIRGELVTVSKAGLRDFENKMDDAKKELRKAQEAVSEPRLRIIRELEKGFIAVRNAVQKQIKDVSKDKLQSVRESFNKEIDDYLSMSVSKPVIDPNGIASADAKFKGATFVSRGPGRLTFAPGDADMYLKQSFEYTLADGKKGFATVSAMVRAEPRIGVLKSTIVPHSSNIPWEIDTAGDEATAERQFHSNWGVSVNF